MAGRYETARGGARFAVLALFLWASCGALAVIANLIRLNLVDGQLAGQQFSSSDVRFSDDFVRLTAWLAIGAYALAGVAFLLWLHRIVRNNMALGALGTRFSPAWAVGCWFVPIVNLLLPVQAVREAWRWSDPARLGSAATTGAEAAVPLFVGVWWLLFLLGNLARIAANRRASSRLSWSDLQQSAQLELIGFAAGIVASYLAVAVVRRLTARQEAKAAVIAASAGGTPRAPGWPYRVAGADLRGANLDPPGRGPGG